MKFQRVLMISIVLAACLAVAACSFQNNTPPPTDANIIIPIPTEEPTSPPATEEIVVEVATNTVAEIVHVNRPDEPSYIATQFVRDCAVGDGFVTGGTVRIPPSCDLWEIDFVERPTNAGLDVYYPYLDIVEVQFGANVDWVFARIKTFTVESSSNGEHYYYGIEIDLDFDKLSDIFISVEDLQVSDVIWTVDGVRAWNFQNGEVTMFFDEGAGADADMIWVRRTPEGVIEFGMKPSALGGDLTFGWWAWAYQGEAMDASQFIPLDAMPSSLYAIDNSCAFGFNGDASSLPNFCR